MLKKAEKKYRKELKRRRIRVIKDKELQLQIRRSSLGQVKKDPAKLQEIVKKHFDRKKKKNVGTKIQRIKR